MQLLSIILATIIVSLFSLIGATMLMISKAKLESIVLILVSLSAGGLLGGAFLHLIPESLHELGEQSSVLVLLFALIGFCLFLITEQFLHWHHGHHGNYCCKNIDCGSSKKEISTLILIGDGVHNFIDGLVIASAFLVDPVVGIVATIAVALHEIPQEIGDFGVLVYAGLKRSKALFYNLLSGLTAVLGGLIGFFFAQYTQNLIVYILPIAAGGFIFLAASDLIPEIKHHDSWKRMAVHFIVFIIGIGLMLAFLYLPFGEH
jgi:zinc and cadmium transporter